MPSRARGSTSGDDGTGDALVFSSIVDEDRRAQLLTLSLHDGFDPGRHVQSRREGDASFGGVGIHAQALGALFDLSRRDESKLSMLGQNGENLPPYVIGMGTEEGANRDPALRVGCACEQAHHEHTINELAS